MLASYFSQRAKNQGRFKFKVVLAALCCLNIFAIVFALLIIQVQAGTSAYLSGLSVWSRAQVETIRQSEIYIQSGNRSALEEAKSLYQIPLGDLQARRSLEGPKPEHETARQGFLLGANHPDDIPRMIWLFRLFQNAPYFRDAISAWRASDQSLLALGTIINNLEFTRHTSDRQELARLELALDDLSTRLSHHAMVFRDKMSTASRALANILSATTIIFFALLSSIATILIMSMTATIRSSELKFRKTFEHAAIGIAQLNERGQFLDVNDTLCKILKYASKDLLALTYNELIYPEDRYLGIEARLALENGLEERVCLEQRLCCGDKSVVWTKITMSAFAGSGRDSKRFIGIVEDVSEQHRLSEELSYQARHDDLTGLINRRTFEVYLEEALLRAKSENFTHGLCFIDLDQFKAVNDTAGHLVGDLLLKQVAKVLNENLRRGDLLARLGGDEFGLILECCEPAKSLKLAENLRQSLVDMPFLWEGKSYNIGCSIGVVPITSKSGGVSDLLRAADTACHMSKEQGRNRVLLAYEDDQVLSERRVQMEWLTRIRDAINNDGLFLEAQRIVSLQSRDVDRVEILVRMKGEHDELILPEVFLPAAERFGLVHLVDLWVIEQVCQCLESNPKALQTIAACHINLSVKSFEQKDFTDATLNLMSKYQIPAEKLCFEITEMAAIANLVEVSNFILAMRQIGCTFALDDFGTGFSSFAFLKQLDVEIIKIDGSFVQQLSSDETDQAMVKAITEIGRTLGKKMVAEFVEDQASLAHLSEMGVEYAQGYHLHVPEALSALIKR